jgi:hypothetical protein
MPASWHFAMTRIHDGFNELLTDRVNEHSVRSLPTSCLQKEYQQ